MESALVLRAGIERLFRSVKGSKGVWGMEDSPTILRSTLLPQASPLTDRRKMAERGQVRESGYLT